MEKIEFRAGWLIEEGKRAQERFADRARRGLAGSEDLVRLTAERRISMADANGGDDIENAPHDGTEVILFWPAIGALPSMRRIGMWLPRTYGTCFLR